MRITELDKRRAIKRLPEFKKDHTQYKKIKDCDSKIRRKIELEKKCRYEIERIICADDVAEHRHDAPTVDAVTPITDDP
ncbi:MAG: hypothetical protein ACLP9S_00590 [Syntrophales bacterium]|jgi:hypothetical protein